MELNVKEYGPMIVHRIFKKSDEGTQLEFLTIRYLDTVLGLGKVNIYCKMYS
jgi:hypothetical protein